MWPLDAFQAWFGCFELESSGQKRWVEGEGLKEGRLQGGVRRVNAR
jgi:hypothetical protein